MLVSLPTAASRSHHSGSPEAHSFRPVNEKPPNGGFSIRASHRPPGDPFLSLEATKKSLETALNPNQMFPDQVVINPGFDFRWQVSKPSPAKPSNNIAQVEGSGTAEVSSPV